MAIICISTIHQNAYSNTPCCVSGAGPRPYRSRKPDTTVMLLSDPNCCLCVSLCLFSHQFLFVFLFNHYVRVGARWSWIRIIVTRGQKVERGIVRGNVEWWDSECIVLRIIGGTLHTLPRILHEGVTGRHSILNAMEGWQPGLIA